MCDFNAGSSTSCKYDISNNKRVQFDFVYSMHSLEY